jgi:hypothetical protein
VARAGYSGNSMDFCYETCHFHYSMDICHAEGILPFRGNNHMHCTPIYVYNQSTFLHSSVDRNTRHLIPSLLTIPISLTETDFASNCILGANILIEPRLPTCSAKKAASAVYRVPRQTISKIDFPDSGEIMTWHGQPYKTSPDPEVLAVYRPHV